MTISGAQCRAARALLGWSQDQLAKSANVARGTIADFERVLRFDLMRQNMLSLVATLEAAGVEFIPETTEGIGAGVRFRKVELEYIKDPKIVDGGLLFQLRYRGQPYRLQVTQDALYDLGGLKAATDSELVRVAQDHLGLIMRRAELKLESGDFDRTGRVLIAVGELS